MSYGPFTHNPWEHDETPIDPDEGRYSPCACGADGCEIDGEDETNVCLAGQWYAAGCVALCGSCGEVSPLRELLRVGPSRWVHEMCPDLHVTASQEADAKAAERAGK